MNRATTSRWVCVPKTSCPSPEEWNMGPAGLILHVLGTLCYPFSRVSGEFPTAGFSRALKVIENCATYPRTSLSAG